MDVLGVAVVFDALFSIQTAVLPFTAMNVEPSNIAPTLTSDLCETSYISKPLSPCQRAKFVPTCKEDARPVVFIIVGCALKALLSGSMRIDPRSDASSGAVYMFVTALAMAFVFGKGEA
jgi:hypothetical protein